MRRASEHHTACPGDYETNRPCYTTDPWDRYKKIALFEIIKTEVLLRIVNKSS